MNMVNVAVKFLRATNEKLWMSFANEIYEVFLLCFHFFIIFLWTDSILLVFLKTFFHLFQVISNRSDDVDTKISKQNQLILSYLSKLPQSASTSKSDSYNLASSAFFEPNSIMVQKLFEVRYCSLNIVITFYEDFAYGFGKLDIF